METFNQVKAQGSFEYLLIVALTFAIIVPTIYLFYNYSKESSQGITDAQIVKLGKNIVDTAESIFSSGQNSKTVLELNVPERIESIVIIDGRELIINMSTPFGVSEIVFFSNVNISTNGANCDGNICNIPGLASSGLKKVKIEARNQYTIDIVVI